MESVDNSSVLLRTAIERLRADLWLRSEIIEAMDERRLRGSISASYRRYFQRLVLALDDSQDAEMVERLSERMLRSEAVVNAHRPSQRDHLRHTIHDFLLGYLILNSTAFFEGIARRFAGRLDLPSDEGMACLNHAWFLASHFHDLGYAVEVGRSIEEFLRQLSVDIPHVLRARIGTAPAYSLAGPLAPLYSWRSGLYGEAGKPIPALPSALLREQVHYPDHGLTAAFLFWQTAEECDLRRERSERRRFNAAVLRTAAVACASHNFPHLANKSPWFQVSLSHDPVSFLLILVDNVQDWSRERGDLDYLWERGVFAHQFARARLQKEPTIRLDDDRGLRIGLSLDVVPFLSDSEDVEQQRRAHKRLQAELIKRSGELGRALRIDLADGVHLRADYGILWADGWGQPKPARAGFLAFGETQSEQALSLSPPARVSLGALAPAWAEERSDAFWDSSASTAAGGHRVDAPGLHSISLSAEGAVALPGIETGHLYLLLADGGVGKSTLLQALGARPPDGFDVRYTEHLPEEPRRILLEAPVKGKRLVLLDHIDHALSGQDAEYWKREFARFPIPEEVAVIAACRTEVMAQWPFTETWGRARRLLLRRQGYETQSPEALVRAVLHDLPGERLLGLAELALQCRGERWIAASADRLRLGTLSKGILRTVHDKVRFFHDHVQDALAALAIIQRVRRESNFDLDDALVHQPPWTYAFLLLSLCGADRGVSPLLDVASHVYLDARRAVLQALGRTSKALQWLDHTGANEVGPLGQEPDRFPICELEKAIVARPADVRPEDAYLVRELSARLHQKLYVRARPRSDESQSSRELARAVEVARSYENLNVGIHAHFSGAPWSPVVFWTVRRRNNLLARVHTWCMAQGAHQAEIQSWSGWREDWEREVQWVQRAEVQPEVKDYWMAVLLGQRGHHELLELEVAKPRSLGPTDRGNLEQRLQRGIDLLRRGMFHHRRALRTVDPSCSDGFATRAQALANFASLYNDPVQRVWAAMVRLGADTCNAIQMTLECEEKVRTLWDQAREVRERGELLSRFYPQCVDTPCLAEAIRQFRGEPEVPLSRVEVACAKVFEDWLKPYPFEATRVREFEGARRSGQLDHLLRQIRGCERLLRVDAQRWVGG